MQNGTFPRNIQISTRCACWRESAVNRWMQNPIFYEAEKEGAEAGATVGIRPLPKPENLSGKHRLALWKEAAIMFGDDLRRVLNSVARLLVGAG